MTDRHPPKPAEWLLQRLIPATPRRESLIGDLSEQYRRGRSRGWYWGQVVAAIIVGIMADLRDHKLLAARALLVGWGVYLVAAFPVNWLSEMARDWVQNLLGQSGHYTFWTAFWLPALPGRVLVWVVCAISGWIVARLHSGHSAPMVVLFAATNLLLEQRTALFLIIALRDGHPPVPTPALLMILVFAVARPMSILFGGLIAADDTTASS